MNEPRTYAAFADNRLVAAGDLRRTLLETKAELDRNPSGSVLVFEDQTGRQVDFDFRGSADEVLARALPPKRSGPGRPRLGVISREVSLLPRHWEWLEEQPNGISAALRRLVDEAKKREPAAQRARRARDAADRFMSAMAGNLPGYEEASRALYAGDEARFGELIRDWPRDVREHAAKLAQVSFAR